MASPDDRSPGESSSRGSMTIREARPQIQCATCSKTFRRIDALRRHQAIHSRSHDAQPTRKKACVSCVKSKIRCCGQRPTCSTCSRRGITCSYDHGHVSSAKSNSASDWSSITPPATNRLDQDVADPAEYAEVERGESVQIMGGPTAAHNFPDVFTGFDFSGPFFEADIQNTFDWKFCQDFNGTLQSSTPRFDQDQQWNMLSSSHCGEPSGETPFAQGTKLSEPSEPLQSQSPLDHLSVPTAHNEEELEDRWPMFWRPEPVLFATLASLGNSEEVSSHQMYHSLPTVSSHHINAFTELLGVSSEQWLWSGVDLSCFPSGGSLDHCIDRYFVHFDKWVPILHRPTFDPGKDPMITLAVIAIGACFTNFDGAHNFSNSVMELSRRLLIYMAEREPRFVRTEYYVTTQLLHGIHGFACGSKRSYELAERTRSSLVNNARCARLFEDYPLELSQDDDLETQWKKWIRAEGFRRVAWAVYVFDAASASMRDDRPFISLNEIKMALPCLESHWEAETPQAWVASKPWSDTIPRTGRFDSWLGRLLQNPKDTLAVMKDNYQRYLMLITLTRIMWSYKEQTTQPAARFLSPYDTLIQAKSDLLDVVDQFRFSPENLLGTTAPEHFTARIQQLSLVHLAHILTGDDIWDYLHLIWRPHPQGNLAREHVLEWMRHHPRSFRAFTTANVQLVNIIRLYPANHPQEPYNVFHAGMAVWVMSTLGSQLRTAQPVFRPRAGPSRPVCNLDWLGRNDTPESLCLRDWVANGGDHHVVRMHGVPDLFAPDAPQQILRQTANILNRMSVWGVARTFMNATLRILHSRE